LQKGWLKTRERRPITGSFPGMEAEPVQGRTTTFPQGDPSTVLFDTTQVALERAISGAAQRQQALASNLANANTPGYQRVDVDFHGTLAAALGRGTEAVEHATFATRTDAAGATRADGSTVDVDAESAKLAANALVHQAAVQVAAARVNIMKAAIGAGG
jgi:flagellar basal-body rod protein FlgB